MSFYLSFLMQFSRYKFRLSPLPSWQLTYVSGGDNETRTRDLLRARQALSQLSYAPRYVDPEQALKIE